MVDVLRYRPPIAMNAVDSRSAAARCCVPDGYEPLPHQVAGHQFSNGKFGMLRRRGDRSAVLKPIQKYPKGAREVEFYQRLFSSQCGPELRSLQCWVPRYYGVTDVVVGHGMAEEKQGFLLLEDQAARLHCASVLDVKIGRRCWDTEASAQKIEVELSKYPQQESLGYRISAMRVYDQTKNDYEQYSKHYGLSLDGSGVLRALRLFFWNGKEERRDVIRQILSQLHDLMAVFQTQSVAHFYSSSLLILYDGVQPASASTVRVKMIDFAHTFVLPLAKKERDENYIYGLSHFIDGLRTLL